MTFLRRLDSIGGRTISNTLVFIRTLYNAAIAQNLAKRESYPFGSGDDRIKIKFPESIKVGLSIEEIQKIERLDLSNNPLHLHARNIWLFSFYLAGMRVGDVLKVKWNDIQEDRIMYRMSKNNKSLSLKIPDKAFSILDHYRPLKKSTDDYVFPDLKDTDATDLKSILRKTKATNKKINNYLKQIATLAEIDKKLTMHIARHSFGNISGDKIPIQMLQKLYRHSSITTTINYQQNFMHKDTGDALDAVINF